MLWYDERRKAYKFEVSMDDSRVVHVEQAPGYVCELQSKIGQVTHRVGWNGNLPVVFSWRTRSPSYIP